MKIEKKYLEIPFDCIKDLVIEPCLKFNSDGLFINSFSDCNSAMCIFSLPKEKFVQYEFGGEEKFKISSELFAKIMKRIKTQFMNLEFKDQKIIISDENKKEYAIAVMHDDEVERDMSVLELSSSFKMKSSELQNLFLDAEIVGDVIKLETKEKLIISSGELNKFNQEIECDPVGQAKASYGIEYLNKFMNASKYFENVLFEFSSDSPCRLTFDGELRIQFILAPRVE
ncbi:MAG: hypothetical protein KAQ92_02970 [Candidatus Aenigmarchaeota archaeon]|nr:hypothetical protein [Candidatus Aenigmarchaeota archaeon]